MTNYIIDFAGLGIRINPPASFSIGPFDVHLYGVIIALGLVLAVVYALRRREQFGISEDDLMDGVLWIAPFAILCPGSAGDIGESVADKDEYRLHRQIREVLPAVTVLHSSFRTLTFF